MNLQEAKLEIAKENPDAIFVEVAKGYFEIQDFTYSNEVRAVIAEYDDCFDEIFYPEYDPCGCV